MKGEGENEHTRRCNVEIMCNRIAAFMGISRDVIFLNVSSTKLEKIEMMIRDKNVNIASIKKCNKTRHIQHV